MVRRPSKPGSVYSQHVPVSPSHTPANEMQLRKIHTSNAPTLEEIKRRRLLPQIELPNGSINEIKDDSPERTFAEGGTITWPIPFTMRSVLGCSTWEITTNHPIQVARSSYSKLRLYTWICQDHFFGPAYLSPTGLVRPVEEGGEIRYKKSKDGPVLTTKGDWLWNLLADGE